MLKILYAADNRISSGFSLKRFLNFYSDFYNIKTAAFTKSIHNINVNWTLDALLDFRGRFLGITTGSNSNFGLLRREIQRFKPDIIISDLEVYVSYIGIELGIPVWQISPLLLYYGTNEHQNLYKYYAGTFFSNTARDNYVKYILNNSDKKLVLSHLGDLKKPPALKPGYEWVRPIFHNDEPTSQNKYGVQLADSYYTEGVFPHQICDYSDPESIITCYYNKLFQEQNQEININPDIKFVSQYLDSIDI